MKFQAKKNKSTQYVIGGTVAVIILALWISIPLMSGSTMDASVSAGNPFHSKLADISLLGSDISSESGAPGSPLNGEMINNPATSGEEMASSLFQSGPDGEDSAEAKASASADVAAPAPGGPSASGGAPAPSGPRGKLSAAPSITAGNANSMSAGTKHDKFFGSGAAKSDFTPAAPADMKKMASSDKKNSLVAMLNNTADKSQFAAKTGNMDTAKGSASSAFAGTAKSAGMDLNSGLEANAISGGLKMGQAADDLKKNDPSLSKTKITPPSKPKDATNESEQMKQQIKMMIIQMVLKMALGMVFGVAA